MNLIVCVNKKGFIGKDNGLLYKIGQDLYNFKLLTTDRDVIMGRNTFESIGLKEGLPRRRNIVLTSDNSIASKNVLVATSIEGAMAACKDPSNAFVIGGESVYKAFMGTSLITKVYLTIVDDESEGDASFDYKSLYNEKEWRIRFSSGPITKDGITYSFVQIEKV